MSSQTQTIDKTAASIAVIAIGLWIGGLLSLGACAAPMVFRLTPAPFSGNAMGAAFARFDRLALGCAMVLLLCEGIRTWIARAAERTLQTRIRRLGAILMSGLAAYVGLVSSPRINALHLSGVERGIGPEGILLDQIHQRAELFGKLEILLGLVVIILHIFTLQSSSSEKFDGTESPSSE